MAAAVVLASVLCCAVAVEAPRLQCQDTVIADNPIDAAMIECAAVMPACPAVAPTDGILAATALVEISTVQRSFSSLKDGKVKVNGHLARLRSHGAQQLDAGRFVSVVAPANRCGASDRPSLRTVRSAAAEYRHEIVTTLPLLGKSTKVRSFALGCRLAVNAGLFHTSDGACTSSVVSDGEIVHVTPDRVPYFGVLASRRYADADAACDAWNRSRNAGNALLMGYLTPEDTDALQAANDDPFRPALPGSTRRRRSHDYRQLIGGLGLLVKDGADFISSGIPLREEAASAQETGTLANFAEAVSARTSLGITQGGDVVIIQVDGRSWWNGLDLYTMTDWIRSLRLPSATQGASDDTIQHAMNLDGGGSATMVRDGVLINAPSYACNVSDSVNDAPQWTSADEDALKAGGVRCERPVSSVLCMHDLPVAPTLNAEKKLVLRNGCACTQPRASEDEAAALQRLAAAVAIDRWVEPQPETEARRHLRRLSGPVTRRMTVDTAAVEHTCVCTHMAGKGAHAVLEGVRTRLAEETYVI